MLRLIRDLVCCCPQNTSNRINYVALDDGNTCIEMQSVSLVPAKDDRIVVYLPRGCEQPTDGVFGRVFHKIYEFRTKEN